MFRTLCSNVFSSFTKADAAISQYISEEGNHVTIYKLKQKWQNLQGKNLSRIDLQLKIKLAH